MLSDSYHRKAVVTHVVDGDTFDALVDLGFYVSITQRFRILGINAPEIKGSTKEAGLKSKAYLTQLIENQTILIQSNKLDSFRRSLANVYITREDGTEESVAQLMVDAHMAEWKAY